MAGGEKESFDNFLLSQAVEEGATHMPLRIDRIEYKNKPVLYSQNKEIMDSDLVAGCFGVNSTTGKIFEEMGIGYRKPPTISAIAELRMTEKTMADTLAIHKSFLIPDGARLRGDDPKGQYVTLYPRRRLNQL
jgi:hypothetical protein